MRARAKYELAFILQYVSEAQKLLYICMYQTIRSYPFVYETWLVEDIIIEIVLVKKAFVWNCAS